MKATLRERVQLGVAFIKGVYGKDALTKIDAQTLALHDGTACVLGQLGGDYTKETTRLNLTRVMAYHFGFIATPRRDLLGPVKEGRAFGALNRAWKREINEPR